MVSVQVYPYSGFKQRINIIKNQIRDRHFTDVGNALFIYENDGIYEEENVWKLCRQERLNTGGII